MQIILLNPIEVRRAIWKIMAKPIQETIPPGLYGASVGVLNQSLLQIGERLIDDAKGGFKKNKIDLTELNRHTVLGFIFTPDASQYTDIGYSTLNEIQKYALYRWIKPNKPEPGGGWIAREGFITEARWILAEAKRIRASYIPAPRGEQSPFSDYLEEMTIRFTDQNLFSQLESGGRVAEGLKHGGQITMVLDEDNVTGQHLCDWCGEVPAYPDQPCKSCIEIGATPENNPKRKSWPSPQKPAKAPNQEQRVMDGLDYCLARLSKIRMEANFRDTNSVNLLEAYEYISGCGVDQIEPEQDKVDQFLFCLGQYQKADALY